MNRTTIAALLLAVISSPAAAEFTSPTYNQASDLAAGRTVLSGAYDGSSARSQADLQAANALASGGLLAPTIAPSSARLTSASAATMAAGVPRPNASERRPGFLSRMFGGMFSKHGLIYEGAGAAVGAGAGWYVGGPVGAAIGAAAGFLIGFLLSKFLH